MIDGWDYPYWNALSGCRNIKKLTAGNPDVLGAILWDLDLMGCDQLVEFDFREWECEDSGYRCVDGAIYEDWGDGEPCLLLWPNAKRPIKFAKGTVEVDCDAFRYVKDPAAITELTIPSGCWLDFWCLAEDYGFTGVTKLVFEGEAEIDSSIVEVLPNLTEIVYSPSPFYAENWEWIREDFGGTGVKFTVAEPDEPLYGYELDIWDEDEEGNILNGECYLGYEGYPFVYPALEGACEIPEKIENCRVVWAYENAFADMSELTELVFPQNFRGFDAGSYRDGYYDTNTWTWVTTGEVDIVYSPFVGCTSLKKLTFNGTCPEGLWEVLEVTPSIREVVYNGIPWTGDSGCSWSEFVAEFQAEHPNSQVVFTPLEIPEVPLWNVDSEGWLCGEYYPEDGIRIPCVWPDLAGEATVPNGVYGIGENAFACMSNLTALTFPQTLYGLDAGVQTVNKKTGVTLDHPRTYSPFVGCTSLAKLTFDGYCPEGLWEVLELTPSIREVYYNDNPWYGESGWIWRDFIAEFKAEYPESNVTFIAQPLPEEPIWSIEDGELYGEYEPETGWRMPCVWPDLVGEATVPDGVWYIGENAFACMSNLTALTIPASVEDVADTAFVGCASLKKLVFEGGMPPDGVWELLELMPSIEEVVVPGWKYRQVSPCDDGEYNEWLEWFVMDYKAEHPDSKIVFTRAGGPDESVWYIEDGELHGEYDPETGWCVPCVWPDLVGEAMVPSNVYYIGENAFACMSDLTALTIPASVENFDAGTYREGYWDYDKSEWVVTGEVDIVYSPFVGCTSLKKLVFQGGMPPEGVWELLELTPSIEEVVVPSWMYLGGACEEGVYNEWLDWFVYEYKAEHPDSAIVFKKDDGTVIGGWEEYVPWKVEGDTMTVDWWAELDEGVFDGVDLSAVTRLVLPPYLDYVEDGAFGALKNLREVEVIFTSYGDEATYFGPMFGEGQRLKLTIKPEIWWECDCELCESEDEGLCPICKSDDEWGDCDENCGCPGHWEIEDFVIQSEQFENAEWIETLVIEEPAFAIADYAFAGCVNLKKVTIPASVEWMGESVFAGCEKLEAVYYNGNAPYGCLWLYEEASSNLVSYVKYGTTGWTGIDGDIEMPADGLWPVWDEDDPGARPVEYGKATVKFFLNDELLTSEEVAVGEPFALIPDPGKTGYTFDGWYDEVGEKAADGAEFTIDDFFGTMTFSGALSANTYAVRFDANGGEGTMSDQKFTYDQPQTLTANAFTRKAFEFLGWARTADGDVEFADSSLICNLFAENGASMTLYAIWERVGVAAGETKMVVDEATGETKTVIVLPETEPEFTGEAAAVYDGFVMSVAGEVVGTIQVKAAKANKKSGISTLTATVQIAGEKKLSFKGGEWGPGSEYAEMALKDGRVLTVAIGAQGLVGTFGEYEINGSANIFSSKDKETKAIAKAVEDAWVGAINVVGDGVVLSVAIAKKGKVKVSGTVEGAKVSATSQLLVGAEACCVPVVITKKANLAFNLWLMADGSVEVVGLDGAVAGKAGMLRSGATFRMDGAAGVRALPGLYGEYLPNGIDVAANGTKWIVAGGAKAGKLALVKGTSEIDSAKSKFTENMSGLKLTYKAKDGSFKGSFKVYSLENGKIKAYTANVTGVMIGAKGYGTATIKKPACTFFVTIE